jgi:peroxiredoxin
VEEPLSIKEDETSAQIQKKHNPLLLIAGLFVLGIALALLLFGGRLFDRGSSAEETADLVQIPALSGVNREGVPLPVGGAPLNVGDTAHNFTLPDLDGNQVTLSDFEGKPVIVNFWATWCPPCRLEMPEFQRIYEEYEDDGLVILAVNQAERPETASAFFRDEMGFSYTSLLDEEAAVGEAYGAVGLPATFFVDRRGEVTAVHRGILTREQIESYLEEIIP